MNLAKDQLEHALRLVQQGSMQPEEAVRWLLGQADVAPPQSQAVSASSISTLLNKLGPPPPAIQQDWDRQLALVTADFERVHGQPFPELSMDDIYVDSDNRISLAPTLTSQLAHSTPSSPAVVRPSPTIKSADRREPLRLTSNDDSNKLANSSRANSLASKKTRLIDRHRWLAPAAVFTFAGAALGITFFLFNTGTPQPREIAKSRASAGSSIFSPTSNPAQTQTPVAPSATSIPSSVAPPVAPAPPKESRATMGLDSFAGGSWVTASDLLPKADFDASAVAPDDLSSDLGTSSDPDEAPQDAGADSNSLSAMSDADTEDGQVEDAPPDSPTTMADSKTTVELPAIPTKSTPAESIVAVPILEQTQPIDRLELSFPVTTGLQSTGTEPNWQIVDAKDQATLATVQSSDESLLFRWTPEAATHASTKQLASGMLNFSFRNGSQQSLFLRPLITAESWPMDLDKVDARAAWPIGIAPPSGTSALSIEFGVPESVLQAWVQAPDPKQFRRSQSIVEFKLDKDPTIAIRARVEIRTGTRVSLRVRHAAQLDPSLPWQAISNPRIQIAIQQVTDQIAIALAEQTNINTVYYKATTTEKKLLAPQRDEIDSIVIRLQKLSERLGKFDRLMSQLHQGAYLAMQLNVNWPDSSLVANQPIFEMTFPNRDDL